jgi:beclin
LIIQFVESLQVGKDQKDEPDSKDAYHSKDITDQEINNDVLLLHRRLEEASSAKQQCLIRRAHLALEADNRRILENCIIDRVNQLSFAHLELSNYSASVESESRSISIRLQKLMNYDSINDAFHIWYSGPFATINNFRLGTLPSCTIEWTEINAAFGQAVLAVTIVAEKAKIDFKKYGLLPLGNFPKVFKVDDRRTLYCLFTDGSFSLFPKKRFNLALVGFLHCVEELGVYVSAQDPTLSLPYVIKAADGMINDQSVLLGVDDEIWTRSLKFLLTDIKWIIAWAAKYCQ